ncbi:neurogenic differentiation factor 1 [Aedes aegypti]|uniref:BHLH domain-containing protein n=1 Tax=Aedes aegypti TaxID=7159 RepID=A0A903VJU4_AEDAE|nr:neurogenic differentiation factor 1 [Aedes aegypti]
MPKRKRSKSPNLDLLEDGFDDDLDSNDDKPGTPIQRNAANARERARMRVLSKAFFNLKRNIPWVPADTKLSKLDTLRLAKNYISYLAATLDGQSVEDFSTNLAQPPKTAWPFIFQPVQPHEPTTKPKLLSASSTGSIHSDKWPNIRANGNGGNGLSPNENNNIKSQHFSPSTTNATSAQPTVGGRSFSSCVESQALGLDRHQAQHQQSHHHQSVIHASSQHNLHSHHQQQHHPHHHQMTVAGIDTSNHIHSFHHHHHPHMAMGSD